MWGVYIRVRSKMKQIAKNYYFHFEHALINRFYHAKSKNVFKIKIACANILWFAHIFAKLEAMEFSYE